MAPNSSPACAPRTPRGRRRVHPQFVVVVGGGGGDVGVGAAAVVFIVVLEEGSQFSDVECSEHRRGARPRCRHAS